MRPNKAKTLLFNRFKVGRKIVFTYPLVAHTDMPLRMKAECQELCSSIMEKHSDNELVNHPSLPPSLNCSVQCAKFIKESMDERYGGLGSWQVRLYISETSIREPIVSGCYWREFWDRYDLRSELTLLHVLRGDCGLLRLEMFQMKPNDKSLNILVQSILLYNDNKLIIFHLFVTM